MLLNLSMFISKTKAEKLGVSTFTSLNFHGSEIVSKLTEGPKNRSEAFVEP